MANKWFSTLPLRKRGRAFNIIIGGRGVGKTFNAIYDTFCQGDEFIFMRRTQDEIDLIGSNCDDVGLSPFAKINKKKGTHFFMKRMNKKVWVIYEGEGENVKRAGLAMALSTIASIRGFDGDDFSVLIFDEFIPESHVKKIGKGDAEGTAFLNAYETINRDREEDGRPALTVFLLANSNDVNVPLFHVLGLTDRIVRASEKGKHFIDLPYKNLTITLYSDAEFVERKRKSALYQLTEGTDFYDMSINNDFVYNDFSLIESRNLKNYVPLASLGQCYIYRSRSDGSIYVSSHRHDIAEFGTTDSEIRDFRNQYAKMLYNAYISHCLIFEKYSLKETLLPIFT